MGATNDRIVQFLSTVAGLSGVLLGLFFALLGTVASTTYSKAPSELRSLLMDEPIIVAYVRQSTFLAAISILVLVSISLRFTPQAFIIFFLTWNSLRLIFYLFQAVKFAFEFFNVAVLTRILIRKIGKEIRSVTLESKNWLDPSFQIHHRKQVSFYLRYLSDSVTLSVDVSSIKKTGGLEIEEIILGLRYYLGLKGRIPTDSKWFREKHVFTPFLPSNDPAKEISARTYAFPAPKVTKDIMWFEVEILNILFQYLDRTLEKKRIETFVQFGNYMKIVSEDCGQSGNVRAGKIVLQGLYNVMEKLIDSDHQRKEFSSDLLQSLDVFILCLESLVLKLLLRIQSATPDVFNGRIVQLTKNNATPYALDFFDDYIPVLEQLTSFIQFESKVEGKIITPKWYIVQLATAKYVEVVSESVNDAIKCLFAFSDNIRNLLSGSVFVAESSFVRQRVLHVYWKIKSHLKTIKSQMEDFKKFKIQDDVVWPADIFDQIIMEINSRSRNTIVEMSKSLSPLVKLNLPETIPDLFGQAYFSVSQEVFDRMSKNDSDCFEDIFRAFFDASMDFKVILRESGNLQFYRQILVSQPIIELLRLSGLCFIYTDLIGNSTFRDSCINTWDNYLAKISGGSNEVETNALKTIFEDYQNWKNDNSIKPNFQEDYRRQIILAQKLDELGLLKKEFQYPRSMQSQNSDWSELIRAVASLFHFNHLIIHDFSDIFVELYLGCRLASKNVIAVDYENSFVRKIIDPLEYEN
ncbi:hypothetical protein F9K33_00375 [bacterium]|nr:MAG: hypothetical protein F9K33_00375 [bacterium]